MSNKILSIRKMGYKLLAVTPTDTYYYKYKFKTTRAKWIMEKYTGADVDLDYWVKA